VAHVLSGEITFGMSDEVAADGPGTCEFSATRRPKRLEKNTGAETGMREQVGPEIRAESLRNLGAQWQPEKNLGKPF